MHVLILARCGDHHSLRIFQMFVKKEFILGDDTVLVSVLETFWYVLAHS